MKLKLSFDRAQSNLEDDQAKRFQELLLRDFGSNAQTAPTNITGFGDVNVALTHLEHDSKRIASIENGSRFLYSSSIPSNSIHNSFKTHHSRRHIHKKRRKHHDGLRELRSSPHMSHPTSQRTKKAKERAKLKKKKRNKAEKAKHCTVASCVALSNIIEVLVWYQTLRSSSTLVPPYSYRYLLNDYHHILHHHLSIANKSVRSIQEEYQMIYNEITKYIKHCEVTTCPAFIRNQRDPSFDDEKAMHLLDDPQISFFMDTLDAIHCYLLHSYHQGMRTKLKYRKKMSLKPPHNRDMYGTHDSELQCITSVISAHTKHDHVTHWRKNIRSKFFTQLPNKITRQRLFRSEPKSKALRLSDHFGFRYYYHEYFRDNRLNDDGPNSGYKVKDMFISRKYCDLKDEMINNGILCLNMSVVQHVITKAHKYSHTKYCKSLYSKDSVYAEYFKIKSNEAIKIHHLMSVILFCDHYDLSICFRSTFRKMNEQETNAQIKNRHREFYHLGRCLNETVQIFGTKISANKTQIYFHGVNQITFPGFSVTFCGPTSCTPILEVAVQSAIQHEFAHGVLLEMTPQNEYSSVMSFDCSSLSCYANECEQLFFGGARSLKFKNIRTLQSCKNYGVYVKAIALFHDVIKGKELTSQAQSEITDSDYHIVQCLMKQMDAYDKYTNAQIPKYIHKLFKTFCASQKSISLSLDRLHRDYKGFQECLVSQRCKRLVRLDYMMRIFVNLKEIKIYNCQNMTDFYVLSLISMLEHMEGIGKLITVKLYDVQYEYQYLDHRFLSKFMMKFQLQSGCKITIDIKDRLIYNETREMYTKYVEHTDLIIIRNSMLHKNQNYKYFMASSMSDDSVDASLDSGDTCPWSVPHKHIAPLNRLTTV